MKLLIVLASSALTFAAPQKAPSFSGAALVPTGSRNLAYEQRSDELCVFLSNGYLGDARKGIYQENLCFPADNSIKCNIPRLPNQLRSNVSSIRVPANEVCSLYIEDNCGGKVTQYSHASDGTNLQGTWFDKKYRSVHCKKLDRPPPAIKFYTPTPDMPISESDATE
ncbi:hypothetical protein SMMN14_05479 [Sphaerulina musiva]